MTHTSARGFWTLTGSLAQSLVGSLLLSLGSRCASPQSCGRCNQILLAFKVKFPGGSQFLCRIPRLGNLLWALELSQQCENFSGIIVLQFVGCLLGHSKVGLMSSKRTQATHHTSQVCGSQSPRPCGRPLLTCASTGDTQRQVWLSLLWGPWVLVHRRVC